LPNEIAKIISKTQPIRKHCLRIQKRAT